MPLWRMRRRARVSIGGEPFLFVGLRAQHQFAWVKGVHLGEWEPEVIDYLRATIRPGDVVFDVGTYVGGYTLLASRLVGPEGRVYAFEPEAATREALEANLRANGADNVVVVPHAISDREGTVTFGGDGDTMARIGDSGVSVTTTTLDRFCEDEGVVPAVMKMDIEGAEQAALVPSAAARTVQGSRAVVVEIHEHRGVRFDAVEETFEAAGKHLIHLETRHAGNYNVAFS
jgi:FkbM family methyltransferase